jgi:hypothetical protein
VSLGVRATPDTEKVNVAHTLVDSTPGEFLNDAAYWPNIPAGVWTYIFAGCHVSKNWLSYPEVEVLGRPLQYGDVREVTAMSRPPHLRDASNGGSLSRQ